jgi:hypothetical protein
VEVTTLLAHVAGVPVEELLPLALAGATAASVGLRLAWARVRLRASGQARRRHPVAPSTCSAPSVPPGSLAAREADAPPLAGRPGEPVHPITAVAPR